LNAPTLWAATNALKSGRLTNKTIILAAKRSQGASS
jgi:hypothetical protein